LELVVAAGTECLASSFTVNVVYNMEPIYGILLAALVFGSEELMSRSFYLDAIIIIGSVLLVRWLEKWADRRA
jgi:hypothetical protein